MKKVAVCFTPYGKAVIEKLNRAAVEKGIRPAEAWFSMEGVPEEDGFHKITEPLEEWTAKQFADHAAILFVGAVGIAVRAIAPSVKDKLSDSPVIVIDDRGSVVIPILSGHAGGADKFAVIIAELLGATPVITTSTDLHGAFAADVFAKEQGLTIRNRDGIKKVSAKAIAGKRVTLSVKDYPPEEPVDLIVADETDREYDLLLSPKRFVAGIGMKKNTDQAQAEAFFLRILDEQGIGPEDVYALATIDLKEEEPAVRHLCDRFGLPLLTFDAAILRRVKGDFSSSGFVEATVGVDNVCERAAVLAAGSGAELVVRKQTENGITLAIARRRSGGERDHAGDLGKEI